jgi:hypothetical protein
MWGSKLALRILQFILALSLIGCAGSTISTATYLRYVENGLSLLLIAPQAIVSAVWSLSDGICILARGGRRGIHPGANVALDLLLWMSCIVGVVIVSFFGIPANEDYLDVLDYRIDRYRLGTSGEVTRAKVTAAAAMGQAMVGLGATLAWVMSPCFQRSQFLVAMVGEKCLVNLTLAPESFTSRPSLSPASRPTSATAIVRRRQSSTWRPRSISSILSTIPSSPSTAKTREGCTSQRRRRRCTNHSRCTNHNQPHLN